MKRAQVTIFIIIGVLLLAAIAFIIFLSTRTAIEEVRRPELARVPQEFVPVQDYVSSCIKQVATEGIKLLGEQGGYIDPRFSVNIMQPTAGDAVLFAEGTDLKVPYWWHMKSDNYCTKDCVFESLKPPLYVDEGSGSIEEQLSSYVNSNLMSCLDFGSLSSQGFSVTELDPPAIAATITPEDVFFSGSYPLRVEKAGAVNDLDEFYVPVNVDLAQAYKLASEITSLQAQGMFLESGARELLALYSDVDKERLPPVSSVEVKTDAPVYWIKNEVESEVQGLLSSHLSLFKASGTETYHYTVSPQDVNRPMYEILYNRNFFLPLNHTYPDYGFRVAYLPWWNLFFDLNCNGQLCTADSTTIPFIPFLGIQNYQFAYDVSFPALVTLTDPDAFDGEGFTFQFFLEANMRNNQPLAGATVLQGFKGERSLFCNRDQFLSGELTVNVVDASNNQPIDGASVMYRCVSDQCTVGSTESGALVSSFPICADGILIVTKPGYVTKAGFLSSDFSDDREVLIQLKPMANVEVSAAKWLYTKLGKHAPWKPAGQMNPAQVDSDEEVVIMLSRIKETPLDDDFATVVRLEGGEKVQAQLVPGEYSIDVMSIKHPDPTVVIPPDERCKEFGDTFLPDPIDPTREEVCYTIPEDPIVFDQNNPLMYGGASLNATLDVREGSDVQFRYFVWGLDKIPERTRIVEDLSEFGKVDRYSKAMRSKLKPVIS